MEVRWHGRGGQGVVTASEILAKAAIREGKWAQAIPMFGMERRGAPILAFTRISEEPILQHTGIYKPDVVVVLDRTLPYVIDIKKGLKPKGMVIIDSEKDPDFLRRQLRIKARVATVDASEIALKIIGRPFINIIMLGAFARATGIVSFKSIEEEVLERFPEKIGIKNIEAAKEAYERVVIKE